jgi:hypothetical protein
MYHADSNNKEQISSLLKGQKRNLEKELYRTDTQAFEKGPLVQVLNGDWNLSLEERPQGMGLTLQKPECYWQILLIVRVAQ